MFKKMSVLEFLLRVNEWFSVRLMWVKLGIWFELIGLKMGCRFLLNGLVLRIGVNG